MDIEPLSRLASIRDSRRRLEAGVRHECIQHHQRRAGGQQEPRKGKEDCLHGVHFYGRYARADELDIALLHSQAAFPFPEGSTMASLNLNGKTVQVDAAPDTPLLWVLRDHLGLTGTKFGCG